MRAHYRAERVTAACFCTPAITTLPYSGLSMAMSDHFQPPATVLSFSTSTFRAYKPVRHNASLLRLGRVSWSSTTMCSTSTARILKPSILYDAAFAFTQAVGWLEPYRLSPPPQSSLPTTWPPCPGPLLPTGRLSFVVLLMTLSAAVCFYGYRASSRTCLPVVCLN